MFINMVKISEKRSVTIPPTRIDTDLLVKVGQMLKEECSEMHASKLAYVSIELNAESRDIATNHCEELEKIAIPSDTYHVSMRVFSAKKLASNSTTLTTLTPIINWTNPIEVEIDVRRPKNSKIRVKGEKATWVQGVTEGIVSLFEKKRLGYRHIAKYEIIRTALSMISSALLTYVSGYCLWLLKIEPFYILLFIMGFFYAMSMLVKRFFDWVFPYFEIASEDFMPRKVRKWALALLWGSGLLPTIIFKIFGL